MSQRVILSILLYTAYLTIKGDSYYIYPIRLEIQTKIQQSSLGLDSRSRQGLAVLEGQLLPLLFSTIIFKALTTSAQEQQPKRQLSKLLQLVLLLQQELVAKLLREREVRAQITLYCSSAAILASLGSLQLSVQQSIAAVKAVVIVFYKQVIF